MTDVPKPTAQDRIAAAVAQTAAANGIGATSMAAVAKAAKVSAGTLYLHFESKEDMLQSVYLDLKYRLHDRLMAAARDALDDRTAISGMWHALLAFQKDTPNGFLFLEFAGAAQVLTDQQKAEIVPLQEEVNAVIRQAMDRGTITAPTLDVAVTLLIGPAMMLARRHAMVGTQVPETEAQQTFDRIWHRPLAGLTLSPPNPQRTSP